MNLADVLLYVVFVGIGFKWNGTVVRRIICFWFFQIIILRLLSIFPIFFDNYNLWSTHLSCFWLKIWCLRRQIFSHIFRDSLVNIHLWKWRFFIYWILLCQIYSFKFLFKGVLIIYHWLLIIHFFHVSSSYCFHINYFSFWLRYYLFKCVFWS